ncbi:putative bifunctional diguanylate cyclase/phosphodiesterase [Catenuloplanes indicus]|uniref:Diguanylate cyclase (GGDEF)-like protein n=1 Tax=Catenuloplanes indicus TaxID=137267 RepID=A0AAE3W113_9ACTN|nr:bifunctional diguanylate cyclase/phosphodiesterase [Catenuloplanes indicus]MDQ0367718.1 diguanylate cyclase (GGDEF)-like protein [Catenuloplanes indicus]
MIEATTSHRADQLLRQLVSLFTLAAVPILIWAGWAAARNSDLPEWWLPIVATAMIAFTVDVGTSMIRIRSAIVSYNWSETGILLTIAFLPPHWALLCLAAGTALPKVRRRIRLDKIAFNTAKAVLTAGLALAVTTLIFGPLHGDHLPIPQQLAALVVAGAVLIVTDDLLAMPVLALATGGTLRQLVLGDWPIRLLTLIVKIAAALAAAATWRVDPPWTLIVAAVAVVVQLLYQNRMRTREERKAWQRLATVTEALNDTDLTRVLHTAVVRAEPLFSANEIEVALGGRLVRGRGESVVFDGAPDDAPRPERQVFAMPLLGSGAGGEIGVLRLRFHSEVRLSEREQYTLRTFASALATAIRNATAYQELMSVAASHAQEATHDQLTGLLNRRALLDRGARHLQEPHQDGLTAMLLVDLNHFKEVNDTLGHTAGDAVLTEVARRLEAAAHPGDIVARLGGDEFAVLLRGLSAPAVAMHRAEVLLDTLHHPFMAEGMQLRVEASGGIAVAPGRGGMTELLRRADVAMYQAKRGGERIATYSRVKDTADIARLALGGDLTRAVEEEEFAVNFQPILDLGTGEVVAAEALSRWHHPVRGHLDPLRFLETVERSGLLPAFTDTVLEKSLGAVTALRDAGYDLPVAVNVSPRSLLDPGFPALVAARLATHDVPADRLVLELTETLALSQLAVVDRVLHELRDTGVRLALDDFGTGYSSLAAVPRIPVQEIKIDRRFVAAMDGSPEAAAVVRATVELGRSLDLLVVAEGVESPAQRKALWELGCGAGQGHLFARSMPVGTLLGALRQGSANRPGHLAPSLHDTGAVVRLATGRRVRSRLPHLPA